MLGDTPLNFLTLVVGQYRQEVWPNSHTIP
jgi:hypothetical protein